MLVLQVEMNRRESVPTFYANTNYLPRELRGEPATGDVCHHGRALAGEGCPACGAEAVSRDQSKYTDDADTIRYSADDSAVFPGATGVRTDVREIAPLSDDELSEIVYGYVTAATWTDLLLKADSEETGSAPYEYGPDDLDTESLARVREIVASFVGVPDHWSFATTANVRLYEDWVGGGHDRANDRDFSALERLGHVLYLSASDHGVSFTDDAWPERDDMPRERREYNGLLRRLERAASGHGLDGVMMCSDGSIQVQG
jgi:hypothetical protein